jgi:RimJ/RimL family protein N-acetyltransferase
MFQLESARLRLRELNLSDTESLFEILSDPETMQYNLKPYSRKETEEWIKRSIKSYKENRFG